MENPYVYDDMVFEVAQTMLNLSRKVQRYSICFKEKMPSIAWAKEFCTVRICGPRGSGHTTAAGKLINWIPKRCVYLSHNFHAATYFWKVIERSGVNVDDADPIVTSDINVGDLRGMRDEIGAVIFDPAALVSNRKQELIYRVFAERAKEDVFFFIFLE